MMEMMDTSSLSVVCRDLFYFRQLLCEIFNLFFLMTRYGVVVEKSSAAVDWHIVPLLCHLLKLATLSKDSRQDQ